MPQFHIAIVALVASGLASSTLALQSRADEVIELTGQVPVKGFRLDKPYPGNWDSPDKPSGWSLQLNITNNPFEGGSDRFVAALLPPKPDSEGAVVNKDGSWAISEEAGKSWNMMVLGFNIMDFPRGSEPNDQDDGDCPESVFSERCRKQLRVNIKEMIKAPLPTNVPLDVALVLPPSCGPLANPPGHLEAISTTSLESFNKTSSFAWSYHEALGAFEDFHESTWPFVFIWAPSDAEEELNDDHIQFQCVKADRNAKTGESVNGSNFTGSNTTSTTGGVATSSQTDAPAATAPPLTAGVPRLGSTRGLSAAVAVAAFGIGLNIML